METNPAANGRPIDPELELREARRALVAMRSRLRVAQLDVEESRRLQAAALGESDRVREQLIALRRSRSWRVTRILRVAKRDRWIS